MVSTSDIKMQKYPLESQEGNSYFSTGKKRSTGDTGVYDLNITLAQVCKPPSRTPDGSYSSTNKINRHL